MKSPYPTRSPERFSRGYVVTWLLALTALAAVASGLKVFTGFNLYDDEGSMMMSVKQYLEGLHVYRDGFSFYGPVYYLYNWLIHTVTATPGGRTATGSSGSPAVAASAASMRASVAGTTGRPSPQPRAASSASTASGESSTSIHCSVVIAAILAQ